ncbi:MAG: choice-of-anchor L domain-containing protein, partial [Flavobacteriales bacterium]
MKQNFLAVLTFLAFTTNGLAQLTADNALTIEQYVQDVLLGQNVSVSNITFNGGSANVSSTAVGGFECVDCNLGIGSGFMMASGSVTGAIGPNNSTSSTLPGTGTFQGNDSDLLTLVQANGGNSVNDWAIIEFDFIPLGDTLRFNYVWGSEEYDTYVGSGFNDVFGFFLSGPGISGPFSNNAENIALVPGTNQGVAINTINNGQGNGGPCTNCEYYNQLGSDNDFFNNMDDDIYTNPFYMQYDGYTDVLTAVGIVQCGQTYHIKLAICDANDSGLDSGIFLERDSFSSNLVVQVELNFEVGGPDGNSLYENCGTGNLIFTRPESFDSDNSFVAYLSYNGSATMGVDYTELPDSIVF